ncbi:hypothetical protein LTR84_001996 [Exophiala bonariae]|uniref:Nephrocystin 3-like N-terminal domain-containing protein n=1 Tax=Exophiala bonariae TaxID=1690606 RepID=A0AAV9NFX7_9EURO|nr:hypothetical protein LTR84_001996 [Exophiala bonariae]
MSRWSQWKSKLHVDKRGKDRSRSPVADSILDSFPSGIKVLVDPPDATTDIVFVHGITGDRERTWTSPTNAVCWPRDLLPESHPEARILTFGYDAYVVGKSDNIAKLDISHHANDLLNALANERQKPTTITRPIIFVAHSLGGLLCKDAIRKSEISGDRHLREIASCTRGIAFIGTPHGGSWLATWAKLPATMLGFVKRTDLSLLSLLQSNSEVLSRIHDDFLSLLRRRASENTSIEVACFYETLPMVGGSQIVDQSSATIPGFNNISIHADHRDIARFSSAQSPAYKSILGVLERWSELTAPVETELGLTHEAKSFLETLAFSEMGVRQAIIEPAESGTCLWILKHPDYKAWINRQDMDKSHGLLWIKGKPGSGKSTLLKHIALANPRTKDVVRLTFFFNARGSEEERNAQGLFKTFLHQLVYESPAMQRRLLRRFRKKKTETGTREIVWTRAELREMFFDALQVSSKTSIEIFVDALDECREEEVHTIVSAFEKCAADHIDKGSHNLKICWSSRHYPHISIDHGFELRVEAMNVEDIELYVYRHLGRSERGKILAPLASEVVSKSQGVFLWSVLVVNKISRLADRGFPLTKIQKVLHDLPTELSKLYAEIISTLDPDLAEDAANLLYLTLYAKRSLNTDELRLGIEFMRRDYPHSLEKFASLDEQVSYFRLFITECSGGLLEVVDSGISAGRPGTDLEEFWGVSDGMHHLPSSVLQQARKNQEAELERQYLKSGSNRPRTSNLETKWIVQVIHETVRDFVSQGDLPGHLSHLPMDASFGNFRLYQMCSRILASDEVSCYLPEDKCQALFYSPPDLVKLASKWIGTSIVEYVMENIFFHLKTSNVYSQIGQNSATWGLLTPEMQHDALLESIAGVVCRWSCIWTHEDQNLPRSQSLDTDAIVKIIDDDLKPILSALDIRLEDFGDHVREGHICLLTLYRKSIDLKGQALLGALSAVAYLGVEHERESLAEQITLEADKDISNFAFLVKAAIDVGNFEVLEMLLPKATSVDFFILNSHQTPLIYAVQQEKGHSVKLLLQYGADPNLCRTGEDAPLHYAASLGRTDILGQLLNSGADIRARNDRWQTAYDLAVRYGHKDASRRLERARFEALQPPPGLKVESRTISCDERESQGSESLPRMIGGFDFGFPDSGDAFREVTLLNARLRSPVVPESSPVESGTTRDEPAEMMVLKQPRGSLTIGTEKLYDSTTIVED